MKHSVLLLSNGRLVFSFAPEPMPPNQTIEQMKDYLVWQQTLKSFLIKDEDKNEFLKYVDLDDSRLRASGVPMNYDLIEVYNDPLMGKKFVRISKNMKYDEKTKKVTITMTCKVCEQNVSKDELEFPICKECLVGLKKVVAYFNQLGQTQTAESADND